MNEIKENARRLLVAHGYADMVPKLDSFDGPHKIRAHAVKYCAPKGVDLDKAANIPSFAAGVFDVLVAELDATTRRVESAAPRDRSVDSWHDGGTADEMPSV